MDQLRIALVGIGQVAMGNYLPVLQGEKDVVLGVYNRNPAKAQEAASKFNAEFLESLDAVAKWNPTSVFVTTSEKARFDVAMDLVRLGIKRMFCEKPLVAKKGQAVVTEDDFFSARTLLDAANKSGCQVAMNFNYRSFDQTLAAKRIIAERKFGALIQAAAVVHYACWSHCIDLIHFFGDEVEELSAVGGQIDRKVPGMVAPDVSAAFRLKNGAVGTILGTAGMAWQHPLFELVLTFENGRLHLRDIDGDLEVLDAGTRIHEHHSMVRDSSRWDHYGTSFRKAILPYLESLRQGTEPPVSGLDGLRELQVEAAIKRSIAEKRTVRVQEEFSLLESPASK